jgi:hypothetical protein
MPFDVPQSRKSVSQNRFEFTHDGVTHSIPLLKFAPVRAALHFQHGEELDGIVACCENEAAKAALLSLDGEQFTALIDAWSKASGVTPGESEASEES